MMINHSTLDCHVTFSSRSLADPERLFETLTLLSDLNPIHPNPIPNKIMCRDPNEKLYQLPYSYTIISNVIETVFR